MESDQNTSESNSTIVIPNEVYPNQLIILPLSHRPMFPGATLPLIVSGSAMIEAVKQAFDQGNRYIGAVLAQNLDESNVMHSELYSYGTLLKIFKMVKFDEDNIQVLAQGVSRFQMLNEVSRDPYQVWEVSYHKDSEEQPSEELKAYIMEIIVSVKELLKMNPLFFEQLKMFMSHFTTEKPGKVMDLIASMTSGDSEKLQNILETGNLVERAHKLLVLLRQEIEVARLQEKIKKNMDAKITDQQKRFFLMEQLKVIKKELGIEKDDKSAEVEKLEKRFKKLHLSEEALKVVKEETEKLKMLDPHSSEYNVVRTYLDWISELPWGIYSKDVLNISKARKVLDKSHYGLEDLKERILEFISTARKRGSLSGSIICLVGPPGVGKTSVGKAIAETLGREFFRFSVGGMRDEAEIKGHRRTYIGAMPGKLIQSLKRTGTANPVIMIDEIDKLGSSYQGDPASALLEVLDPEQNRDFLDHYLDVRFDLSHILFVTTANQLDTIPSPLLDRMEVMKLSGYILREKVGIAKRFLIPKQMKEHGLSGKEIAFKDEAIAYVVEKYAREAGVRGLEKYLKKLMRRVTYQIAQGDTTKKVITVKKVEEIIGKPIFGVEELYNKGVPGVALGLAWTRMGGTTLYIEATAIPKSGGGFKQTGQLGKVMQESSEIAFSFLRSKMEVYGLPTDYFDKHFIHLHVPEGATPKDGPSAGITMTLALYSLVTGKAVPADISMTGEITLTGKVLPIGGVKEKTIAAKRMEIKRLIFPIANQRDFEELPDYLKEDLSVYYADRFEDVLKIVFGKNTLRKRKSAEHKGKKKCLSESKKKGIISAPRSFH